MNDVQKAAQERAAKPGKPIGSSFETERQREKRAVFKQIEGSSGANIHKIAATASAPEGDENKPLRVAAYCRVSTDDLDQAVSIALQIAEYKKKIKANENWIYVGTYVDDGFSGTNTDHGGTPEGTHGGGSDAETRCVFAARGSGLASPEERIGYMELKDIAAVVRYALGLEQPDFSDAAVPEGLFAAMNQE